MVLLTPNILGLIEQAALKSFWRKTPLRNYLRRMGVPQDWLGAIPYEVTKRDLLSEIIRRLEESSEGRVVLNKLMRELAEQTTFPDLINQEESKRMIEEATRAVAALKAVVAEADRDLKAEKDEVAAKERAAKEAEERRAARGTLESFKASFEKLGVEQLGTQAGGYAFEKWFFDLVVFFDLEHRRPYRAENRQIDGSITLQGTTYIVELKFEKGQTDVHDTAIFLKKVKDKSDNTMGIMLSASGFNQGAIDDASGGGSPLLLLDAMHLYLIFSGQMTLDEVISRVRRHSSQYGRAYLAASEFST
jgi:hypothetical protein